VKSVKHLSRSDAAPRAVATRSAARVAPTTMKSQLLIEEHGGVLQWVAASKRVAVVVVVVAVERIGP